MSSQKELPTNCLECPNHQRYTGRNVYSFNGGRDGSQLQIVCTVTGGSVVDQLFVSNSGISPEVSIPAWCPLKEEEQPWTGDTLIPGIINIEIRDFDLYESPSSKLSLKERAEFIWESLHRSLGMGVRFPIELVSTDPIARKAVYRVKTLGSSP